MDTSTDFKIYLFNTNNQNPNEILRTRIVLEQMEKDSFYSHIRYVTDINEPQNINIRWQSDDLTWNNLLSDYDWILFKSKFDHYKSQVVKLRVFTGILHTNIICDICENILFGDRFKCLECDDFDICQSCFNAQPTLHNQHCFILLRKPEDRQKMLISIPTNNLATDFRVVDIDLSKINLKDDKIVKTDQCIQVSEAVETTNEASKNLNEENVFEPTTNTIISSTNNSINGNCNEESTTNKKGATNLKPKIDLEEVYDAEFFNNFPKNSYSVFKTLKEMGYKNDRLLVNLIIDLKADISDIVDELGRTVILKK